MPNTRKILKRWNGEEKNRSYQLRVANRLWGQKGFPFLAGYLALTREQYAAELGIVDFTDQPEAARGSDQRLDRTADRREDQGPDPARTA